MKTLRIFSLLIFGLFVVYPFVGCNGTKEKKNEQEVLNEHDGHDHDVHENNDNEIHKSHDDCESGSKDNEHNGKGDEDNHDPESAVRISSKTIELIGLTTAEVQQSLISRTIELPGEIGFNEDHLVQVTPRYAGIAREVKKQLGEYVHKDDILAVIESNESLALYEIRAPIAGRIIEKNVTPGEYVCEDENMYVMANLATVWANCEIYPKHTELVRVGQKIIIKAVGSNKETQGTISYVAPIFKKATRSAVVRAILSTSKGEWRPGEFVRGIITISSEQTVPVVSTNAVQFLNEESVVFVPAGQNEYKPVEVVTGLSNEQLTQIVSGLQIGDKYVAKGAFELKAKIVTSALGDHAGHGH